MIKLLKTLKLEMVFVSISFLIIILLIFISLFGNWIIPNSPTRGELRERLKPPVWIEGGTMKYPFGTDAIGRCIFSRIISGAKYSLGVSIISIIISLVVGLSAGLVSGFFGGFIDSIIMRLADLILAFPMVVLGIVLGIALGPSITTMIIVLVIGQWARFARQVRGEALLLRETDFVAQAKVAGCSARNIITRHLLPNVMNTVLVLATLQIGWAIMVEASLSFLGAGIPPPTPGWGLMVSDGREYITTSWWASLIPGGAIMVTVLSFNTIGDWVRDRLDPRLKQI